MANEERKVTVLAWPDEPAKLVVRDTVPVCIKLCEPICAESRYEIGVDIFDRPDAKIVVSGTTRFFNCREKP